MVAKEKTLSRQYKPSEQRRKSGADRSHLVRIIGGQWKRTPIIVMDVGGLRPTPDRVRGTLFDWLNHLWPDGFAGLTCLDMFAGTGALGFEAASRGFSQVTMVERNRSAFKQLLALKDKLNAMQIDVLSGDAFLVVAGFERSGKRFDLVCLDPPFGANLLPKALSQALGVLAEGGMIYAESNAPVGEFLQNDTNIAGRLRIVREGHAGQVYYHLLQKQV
jgi:16S rRNA (guanine(966)-N(2))-methyltransferase RsmD